MWPDSYATRADWLRLSHWPREALEGFQRTLGDDNTKTLVALNNLASLLVDMGRASDAEVLYVELLQAAAARVARGSLDDPGVSA